MANEFAGFPSLEGALEDSSIVMVPYVPITAEQLNLEDEILSQYNAARKLYHDSSYDLEVPVNQKAQVLNSISAIIATLVKSQQDLYNMERIKKIESILLATLKRHPELQQDFMQDYKRAFGDLDD